MFPPTVTTGQLNSVQSFMIADTSSVDRGRAIGPGPLAGSSMTPLLPTISESRFRNSGSEMLMLTPLKINMTLDT